MIEKYKKQIPAKEEEWKRYRCDICGIDLDELNKGAYEQSEAIMGYKEGKTYPDGDNREGEIVDICVPCMKDKVMPLVKKEFNIKPRKYNGYLMW